MNDLIRPALWNNPENTAEPNLETHRLPTDPRDAHMRAAHVRQAFRRLDAQA